MIRTYLQDASNESRLEEGRSDELERAGRAVPLLVQRARARHNTDDRLLNTETTKIDTKFSAIKILM